MIKVSALYPNGKDVRFDMKYYIEKHIPLSVKLLSTHQSYHGVSVERGLSGIAPAEEPPYLALAHYFFGSAEGFQSAIAAEGEALLADVPNYTDIHPVFQISEVLMSS